MASCESQETLADIEAWIRRHADVYGYDLADRIETARKLEEAQWMCVAHNHAKRTAVSLAEDGLKSLDVLERACEEVLDAETLKKVVAAKRRIATDGNLSPAGNMAAMCEALETVRKYVKETTPDKVMLGVIEVWCDEALAKPPRNCDRFGGDFKMLHTAWWDWTGSPSGKDENGVARMTFDRWLLAPIEEGGAE